MTIQEMINKKHVECLKLLNVKGVTKEEYDKKQNELLELLDTRKLINRRRLKIEKIRKLK